MAKYHVETTNGTYEVETDEAPPLGEQPASFGGVAKTMANQAGTALSTAASDIASIPSGVASMIRHPIDTLKAGISTPKPPQTPEAQLPQDAFHRLQRRMGGGPNNLAPADTPTAEVVGHGLALGGLNALPSAIRAVPQAADAAMSRVPQGFGVNPDVRAGAMKMAAGAAAAEALPGPLKWPARSLGVFGGARQLWRGMTKPDAAAQEAVSEIPTIKAPASAGNPAVFGDPEGFAKLPPNVQEAILNGTPKITTPSAPSPGLEPRDPSHYGIEPKLSEQVARPEINTLLNNMRQENGLSEGQHLGEVPGAHYPERWAGSDSPTIKSTMAKTKFTKVNPEELGVHGGVENTPMKAPLNTPEKIRIATALANAIKKGGK